MIWPALIIYVSVVASLEVLIRIVKSFRYDIRQINRRSYQQKHPYTKYHRQRPVVSVVIWSDNNASDIRRCLESLKNSSYKKIQLLVVDNASKDGSAKLVKEFIKVNPKITVRLVAKRKPGSVTEGLISAQRHIKGGLVINVRADSQLDPQAIRNAVYYMNANEIEIAQLYTRPVITSISDFFSSYETAVANQRLKYLPQVDHMNIICRKSVYGSVLRFKELEAEYIDDAVIYTHFKITLSKLLSNQYRQQSTLALKALGLLKHSPDKHLLSSAWTSLKYWALLSSPFLIGYFIYLGAYLHQPTLYLLSCTFLSMALLVCILNDQGLKWHEKLGHVLLLPAAQPLVYAYLLIPLIAALNVAGRMVLKQAAQLSGKLQARTT